VKNLGHLALVTKVVRASTKGGPRLKWALRTTFAVIGTLIAIDISALKSEAVMASHLPIQIGLWLLPCVLVPWLLVLSYLLRDDWL